MPSLAGRDCILGITVSTNQGQVSITKLESCPRLEQFNRSHDLRITEPTHGPSEI
jgi:hypothetical protein